MHGTCSTNQWPGNGRSSAEHDQKLITSVETQIKLAHQIWAQFDKQFVCKCVENTLPIMGQETAEIHQIVTRS